MDFALLVAVLWRSKWLLIAGLLLGAVLAALAYGKPSMAGGHPTLTPRKAEVWQSESQLLIAQSGFPYGQGVDGPQAALSGLSPVYATLANGNAVQAEMHQLIPGPGTVKASESVDVATSSSLPFVTLLATAPTAAQAKALAAGAASIFQTYVAHHQVSDKIPPSQRVQLSVVEAGVNTKLSEGHKYTLPILVFLAVLIGVLSIILLRENVGHRVAAELRAVPTAEAPQELHVTPTPLAPEHEYASTNGGDALTYRDPVESAAHRR